ncbi:MAG: hypothetical protein BMS9Abin29_2588 [Gemmatimonadota bacterium]|nr:MAG: hypothetical protein BMS9Abin29_2588 [Gemmatimonadota bacterium]
MKQGRVFSMLAIGMLVGGASGASGQGAEMLVSGCLSGAAVARIWCEEVAVATQALRAGVGFVGAGGTDVPGTSSTLGKKLGSVPRVSASVRATLGRLKSPRVTGVSRPDVDDQTLWVPTIQGSIVVSVLDGFSVVPSVGGLFALDLLATASYLRLPSEFGDNAGTIGVGARLGLLRESFTAPGLSVSVVHRGFGEATYGDRTRDNAEITFDLSTTSVRAIVGKDLPLIGFFAGVGWDWHRGNMSLRTIAPGGGVSTATGDFTDRRRVYFGGTSWSFLVLQGSIEAGWSSGFGDLQGRSGDFSASSRPFFASAALRVTL